MEIMERLNLIQATAVAVLSDPRQLTRFAPDNFDLGGKFRSLYDMIYGDLLQGRYITEDYILQSTSKLFSLFSQQHRNVLRPLPTPSVTRATLSEIV